MFYKPTAWFLTHDFKHSIGSLLSSQGPVRLLFVPHLINSPSAQGKFCVQHCISSPSDATIKYKRVQIAQGPSCETDPLSPFGDFLCATPIAVGVNLTCIRSKLVKKHSSMREAISKIFSKGEREKWRHCLKPLLNILQFCTYRLLALNQPVCEFSILIENNSQAVTLMGAYLLNSMHRKEGGKNGLRVTNSSQPLCLATFCCQHGL